MDDPKPIAAALEARLGIQFNDRELLVRALTHRSFAHEAGDRHVANETMEFLGDALLGFFVAELIMRETDLKEEGEMTKVKSKVVSEPFLADLARHHDLGSSLLLSRGEEKTGGRAKPSILADTYEAVLAAIYLDQGIDVARAFVERDMRPLVAEMKAPGATEDPKSLLQEICHRLAYGTPTYRTESADGPEHRPVFVVECVVGPALVTRGSGNSKKEAERDAARAALRLIDVSSAR